LERAEAHFTRFYASILLQRALFFALQISQKSVSAFFFRVVKPKIALLQKMQSAFSAFFFRVVKPKIAFLQSADYINTV